MGLAYVQHINRLCIKKICHLHLNVISFLRPSLLRSLRAALGKRDGLIAQRRDAINITATHRGAELTGLRFDARRTSRSGGVGTTGFIKRLKDPGCVEEERLLSQSTPPPPGPDGFSLLPPALCRVSALDQQPLV